jgi:hypothetical protein
MRECGHAAAQRVVKHKKALPRTMPRTRVMEAARRRLGWALEERREEEGSGRPQGRRGWFFLVRM